MAVRESSKLWFIQRDFDNSTNDISTRRQPSLRPFPEVCAADRESAVVDLQSQHDLGGGRGCVIWYFICPPQTGYSS